MPASRPRQDAPLRVALDGTPLLGQRSGVAAFCLGALEALAQRPELDVSAFAVTWRRRHLLPPSLPEGVRAVQRAMPARPLTSAWRSSSFPPVEWFIGDQDVVHGTNYVVPPARRAARVVSVHDLTVVRFPELCTAATLRFPSLVRRAVAEGAWVHTDSRFVAEEVVAEFGADPSRVRVVHPGAPTAIVPLEEPSSGDEARRQALALPPGTDRYILSVGTVEPRKDYPGLVRVFDAIAAAHPGVALVIAGGEGWGSAALDAAIETARFGARVLRTGYLSDRQLASLLADASVLAYPSVYEGFGFPPLEAMLAGVPVVATAVGSIPEVVGDAGLLVPGGDPDALAGALHRALEDDALRVELVARGRRRSALFTWAACGEGLSSLYFDVQRERRSGP